MALTLSPDTTRRLETSIKRYFAEHLDQDIGDLMAAMLLDFCLKEIGPSIYNQTIAEARSYLEGRLVDLEAVCYQEEFGYWTPAAGPGGQRKSKGPGR